MFVPTEPVAVSDGTNTIYIRPRMDVQTRGRCKDALYMGGVSASVGSWEAALASALGISTVDATTIYNLFGSVNTELHATFITQMLARVG